MSGRPPFGPPPGNPGGSGGPGRPQRPRQPGPSGPRPGPPPGQRQGPPPQGQGPPPGQQRRPPPQQPGGGGGGQQPPGPRRPYFPDNDNEDPFDYERIFTEQDAPSISWQERVKGRSARRIAVAIGVVIVLLVVFTQIKRQFDPAGTPGSEVTVQVPKGSSFSAVASLLDDKGVVPSAFALKLWTKFDGTPSVQAGEYTFHKNSSDGAALAVLRTGPKQVTDRLTIPEGMRLTQIAERVGRLPGKSAEKFLEVANSGTIRSDYQPADVKTLEGLLFPDTYLLSASDTEETLIRRMVNEFDNQARLAGIERSEQSIGQSPYETVIIASLIESEAKVPGDRGKISQVIENRLRKAMPLQLDASVLYAIGNTKQSLSTSDLKVKSEYNTYAQQGLPPTPISSPGRASIQAALQPTPGPWIYYVVTDASGAHAFATTLDEHNRNIADAKKRGVL